MPSPYALIVLALVAIVVIAYLLWERRAARPQVTCSILPPYEIPDVVVVGTVLVENRGRAPAANVRVEIRYGHGDWRQIHHLRIISDARYVLRGGGEQYSFANLRIERLLPGQKLLIYMAGPRPVTPDVKISVSGPAERPAQRPAPARATEPAPASPLPPPEPAPAPGDSAPTPVPVKADPTADMVEAAIRSLSAAPAATTEPAPSTANADLPPEPAAAPGPAES